MKLSWQTFFCCMVSAFTTDLFNSAFSGFRYEGTFGQFQTDRYILFNVSSGIDMNILGRSWRHYRDLAFHFALQKLLLTFHLI